MLENIGRYTLVERIAEGPTGDVYLAVGACLPGLEKHYAVKVIHRAISGEKGFADNLREEVGLALRFSHPNVVALADVGCEDGRWFVATEAVLGRNLDVFATACRRRNQPPPLIALLYIAREVLLGLEHCHQQTEKHSSLDRVHRDISAGNVLLSFDGGVKLADFGLGLAQDRLRRQPGDRRADVFCVGALLFELISGTRFDPRAHRDVASALRERSVPGQSPVPPAAESLFCRLLSLETRQRFASAQDAARAAQEVIAALDPHYGGWRLAELMNETFGVTGDQASLTALATVAAPVRPRRFGLADEQAVPTVVDTRLHPNARDSMEEPTVLVRADGLHDVAPPQARDTINLTDTDLTELPDGDEDPEDQTLSDPVNPTSGYVVKPNGKIERVRFSELDEDK